MRLINRIVTVVLLTTYGLQLTISPVSAQVNLSNCDDTNPNRFDFFCRFSNIGSLVNVLLPNVLIFAGVILMVYIVIAGFNMIRSAGSGDAEAAGKARQALTYGVIGFVIIFTAALVIQLVEFLTGVSILNPESQFNE